MRVAIYLGEGFEEIEALTVADILRRGEIEVDLVSVEKELKVKGAHNIEVTADKLIGEESASSLDMIVLPGGMPGTINLEKSKPLEKIIKKFNEDERYIGAICAAPSILGKLNMLKGREATSFPGFEKDLKGASLSDKAVVRSDHIITSRGPSTAMAFSLELVKILKGEKLANQLAKGLLLNSEN